MTLLETGLEDIIAIMIPIVLAICFVLAIQIISDAGVRKRLADTQTDPENIRMLLDAASRARAQSALGWAIVLLFVGLALLVIGAFDIAASNPLAFGLVTIAAGLALLLTLALGRRL